MSLREHRRAAVGEVPTAVLTVSDSRTAAEDSSGSRIRRMLTRAGHPVADYRILPDEPSRIRRLLRSWARRPEIRAMILSGGTGVSLRDGTYEAVEDLLDKRLEGFGELFRMLSYREIGSAAYLSRAVAGIYRGRPLFSLPGSEKAVDLAMRKLILPELGHLAREVGKGISVSSRRRPREGPSSFIGKASSARVRGESGPAVSGGRATARRPHRR